MTDDKKEIVQADDLLNDSLLENDFSTDLDDVFDDLSDEMNDFDNDVDYEFPQTNNKQSSMNWFNIAIIGGVVLAIGGAAFMFLPSLFGGSAQNPVDIVPQQEQQLQVSSDQVSRDLAQEAVSQNPLEALQNDGGLLNNPDFLLDEENKAAAALTADIVNTDQLFQKIDNNQIELSDGDMNDLFAAIPGSREEAPRPPEMETLPEQVTQNLPMPSDNPVVVAQEDKIPVFEAVPDLNTIYEEFVPMAQQEMPEPQPEVVLEAIPAPVEVKEEPVVAIKSQNEINQTNESDIIAKLNARIEELSREVESLKNTNSMPSNSVAPVDMTAVQSQLSAIEQRIETIAKAQQSKPSSTKTTSKTTSTKSAPKKYEPAYVPPPRERKPVASISWALRGASPGQAVLAQQGTNAVRTVNVGDTIDGLGRIQSVAVENGKWVVRGTSGTVSQ